MAVSTTFSSALLCSSSDLSSVLSSSGSLSSSESSDFVSPDDFSISSLAPSVGSCSLSGESSEVCSVSSPDSCLNNSPKNYSSVLREDYTGKTRLTTDNANDYDGSFQYSNLEASYEIDTLRLLSMSFGLYGGGNDTKGDGFTQMTTDAGLPVYNM